MKPNNIRKVMLIGPEESGKTTYFRYLNDNTFDHPYKSTLGVEFMQIVIPENEDNTHAIVWDTSGQERFFDLTFETAIHSDGYLAFFNMQDAEASLEKLQPYIDNCEENVPIELIGTHADKASADAMALVETFCEKNKLSPPFLLTLTCDKSDSKEVLLIPLQTLFYRENHQFVERKKAIQDNFLKALSALKVALDKSSPRSKTRLAADALFDTLYLKQAALFTDLSPNTQYKTLEKQFEGLYQLCLTESVKMNQVLRHGKLFRLIEVLAKAVGALVFGVVMIVITPFCQGILKKQHRELYCDTFFTLHNRDKTKAVEVFAQTAQSVLAGG